MVEGRRKGQDGRVRLKQPKKSGDVACAGSWGRGDALWRGVVTIWPRSLNVEIELPSCHPAATSI